MITDESLSFQMLLLQSIKISKLSRCFISFVVGKKMLWSEKLIELIKNFNDYFISLTYYDGKNTILVNYFTKDTESIINEIEQIVNTNFVGENKNLDLNSILNQQFDLYKRFDYGQKKAIIILSTHSNETFTYSFNEPDKKLLKKIYDLGVNIFDYSDEINFVSNENNEKPTFYNSILNKYIQFVPYMQYSDIAENHITLINIINKSPIPITQINCINLDLTVNEEVTFEFNFKDSENNLIGKYSTLRFLFDSPEINVFYSRSFPFPNKYVNDVAYLYDSNDNKKEIFYDMNIRKTDKFYMTVESLKIIDNMLVDIEVCDGKNCFSDAIYFKFYLGFIVTGLLIIFYGIYVCFCDTALKKESNIFEMK